jgi:hypothetical protein
LTSNVTAEQWQAHVRRHGDLAIRRAGLGWRPYTSSMCSNGAAAPMPRPGIAARLGSAIDELAAAAAAAGPPEEELAGQLAAAWALIAEADPELAERTARYAPGQRQR